MNCNHYEARIVDEVVFCPDCKRNLTESEIKSIKDDVEAEKQIDAAMYANQQRFEDGEYRVNQEVYNV